MVVKPTFSAGRLIVWYVWPTIIIIIIKMNLSFGIVFCSPPKKKFFFVDGDYIMVDCGHNGFGDKK